MPTKVLQPLAAVSTEHSSAGSGTYVLELAASASRDCLAAALSDGRCQLYAVSGATMDLAGECVGHKGAITGTHALLTFHQICMYTLGYISDDVMEARRVLDIVA